MIKPYRDGAVQFLPRRDHAFRRRPLPIPTPSLTARLGIKCMHQRLNTHYLEIPDFPRCKVPAIILTGIFMGGQPPKPPGLASLETASNTAHFYKS